MGTREKLFRQKLADQIERLLTESEVVFGTEKLTDDWMEKMLEHTHELSNQLAVYRFLHNLPENEDLQVEFLELQDENKEPTSKEIPSYGDEILKEIDEFESQEAVDVTIVEEEITVEIETEEPEVVAEEEVIDEEVPVEAATEEEEPVAEKEEVEEQEEIELEADEEVKSEEVTEINDKVARKTPSVADRLRKKSIKKLADSIALNERFLYSNELFNGNMEAFNKALNELDHIASKDDADRFITIQLKEDNGWDMESHTVQNFISLVERRFV